MQNHPALLMFYSCLPDCASWPFFFSHFTLFVVVSLEQNNALQCLPSDVYCGADRCSLGKAFNPGGLFAMKASVAP